MAGLVFLSVFWALAGDCQRHGVGGFIVQFSFFAYWRCAFGFCLLFAHF